MVGRVSPLCAAPRLRDDGAHGVPRTVLSRAFDESDFFGRESVEFIDELINLQVGGRYGVLVRGLLQIRRKRIS